MAKKKVKKVSKGMHKMPGGMMMKDSEMKKEKMHDDEMMNKYRAKVKKGKYRKD